MTKAVGWAVAALVAAGVLALSACGEAPTRNAADDATIAFLRATPSPSGQDEIDAFLAELADAGHIAGQSLTLVAADPGEAHPDDAAEVATRWGREGHEVIVALSTTSARIAARSAPEARVLFLSNDPTATGLVPDERRPPGNLTGVTFRVPADRLPRVVDEVLQETCRAWRLASRRPRSSP